MSHCVNITGLAGLQVVVGLLWCW